MGEDRSGRSDPEIDLIAGDRGLYGRRIGRPLRKRAQHAVDEILPRLRIRLPEQGALDPKSLFDQAVREVWLEIGAGNGAHAVWQARQNPDVGVIAVEPFVNGVATLVAAADEAGLRNLRVLDDDARPLLERLAAGSIARTFILFPDPWPKRRHWRRRIVAAPVLDRLACLMPDGAELRIGTDDVGYLVWMLRVLRAHPGFRWAPRCADDWRRRPADWPETRFEEKGREAGRASTYLILRRDAAADCT